MDTRAGGGSDFERSDDLLPPASGEDIAEITTRARTGIEPLHALIDEYERDQLKKRAKESTRTQRWKGYASNWLNGLPLSNSKKTDFQQDSPQSPDSAAKKASSDNGPWAKLKSLIPWITNDLNSDEPQSIIDSPTPKTDSPQKPANVSNTGSPNSVLRARLADQTSKGGKSSMRTIRLPPRALLDSSDRMEESSAATTIGNEVRTAKYTAFNFLLKNFAEQFRRVANLFFVLIVALQCVPAISNYNPFLAALPLLIIMGVTACKDAFEDWRRHKQDEEVNYAPCRTLQRPDIPENYLERCTRWQRVVEWFNSAIDTVVHAFAVVFARLRGKPLLPSGRRRLLLNEMDPDCAAPPGPDGSRWSFSYWRDVRVGDIILLRDNEPIPADMVVLSTSEPDGVCFVETKNLDGETNLKARRAPPTTTSITSASEAAALRAIVQVGPPNSAIDQFIGRLIVHGINGTHSNEKSPSPEVTDEEPSSTHNDIPVDVVNERSPAQSIMQDAETIALGPSSLLLRGCFLKNTDAVIGLVVYTGPHTKLMLNSGLTPSKRTRIERQMNPQIVINFFLLAIICISCAIVQAQFAAAHVDAPFWPTSAPGGAGVLLESPAFHGFLTFWSGIILFQTLVPISMYVTLEIVKTLQAVFISCDRQIFHEQTNTRAVPRAWNLADDLGQIEYVFSDKTGTLTQNVMVFRRCSIAGNVYGYLPGADVPQANGAGVENPLKENYPLSSTSSKSSGSTVPPERWDSMQSEMIQTLSFELPYKYVPPSRMTICDNELVKRIVAKDERVIDFFVLLSVCHTVLIDERGILENSDIDGSYKPLDEDVTNSPSSNESHPQNRKTGDEPRASFWSNTSPGEEGSRSKFPTIQPKDLQPHKLVFKAQSPDEAALVSTARDLGIAFVARNQESIIISILGRLETITILNILEFNSERKRMSVIVRREDGQIMLLCKGADSVIYERLSGTLHQDDSGKTSRASSDGKGAETPRWHSRTDLESMEEDDTSVYTRSGASTSDLAAKRSQSRLFNASEPGTSTSYLLSAGNPTRSTTSLGYESKIDIINESAVDEEVLLKTHEHIEAFAEDGLRTLCFAQRHLSEEEYESWSRKYIEACTALEDRERLVENVSSEIEQNLELLGATAIEDRLQDGVPECIETLQIAGIKIWVLTGDKLETAINIGFSCRLLRKDMLLLVIQGSSQTETEAQLRLAYERVWEQFFRIIELSVSPTLLAKQRAKTVSDPALINTENIPDGIGGPDLTGNATVYTDNTTIGHPLFEPAGEQNGSHRGRFAMIIDGGTLKHALESKTSRKLFLELATHCDAVVCCRVSPLQKAKVVELVRYSRNAMTLAIGDGANDVSMLQAADVGVGVAGQEGMQAVMSSDYAIAQFRFLSRLLLVHGRWAYLRVAEVTLLSLYKNIVFVVLLYWYQFYCGFTAQYVYDYMYLLFFNVIFTILPLLALGAQDQDIKDIDLLAVPPVYRMGIRQSSYSLRLFLLYLVDALFQSAACFFIPLAVYADTAVGMSGLPETQTMLGNAMALAVVLTVNMYAAINYYSWTIPMGVAPILSVGSVIAFLAVYSLVPSQRLYGSLILLIQPRFLFALPLACTIALAPRIILKYVQTIMRPTDLDIVREIRHFSIGETALMRSIAALKDPCLNVFNAMADEETAREEGPTEKFIADAITMGREFEDEREAKQRIRREKSESVFDIAPPKPIAEGGKHISPGGTPCSATSDGNAFEFMKMDSLPTPQFDEIEIERDKRKSKGRSWTRKLLRRSLALFNFRTAKWENVGGYAFSQDEGMGRVVTAKSPTQK